MPVANPSNGDRANNSPAEVLIFAKAPVPGDCKTRLSRRLGVVRAVRIYKSMLEIATCQACALDDTRVSLVCTPDTRNPLFARLRRRYGAALIRQSGGSLGQRMHRAIGQAARRTDRTILMGSDQPADLADALCAGLRSLDEERVWIAPTFDGGYWAIGLSSADSRIFRGPQWSTSRVITATQTACRRLKRQPVLWSRARDIDEGRDWGRMPLTLRSTIARNAVMPGLIDS
jgi:rSAM/selenodomain-associated transferase 1